MAIPSAHSTQGVLASQSTPSHLNAVDVSAHLSAKRPWWKLALFCNPITGLFMLMWELLRFKPICRKDWK